MLLCTVKMNPFRKSITTGHLKTELIYIYMYKFCVNYNIAPKRIENKINNL